MYAQVFLVNGFNQPLWYTIPVSLQSKIKIGSLVSVPLRQRKEVAVVHHIAAMIDNEQHFIIRELEGLVQFPEDAVHGSFLDRVAHTYFVTRFYFYRRIKLFLKQDGRDRIRGARVGLSQEVSLQRLLPVQLTEEQQKVVDYVSPLITTPSYAPVVVHGVTGSGKTEIYKKLIQQAVDEGKSVIMLLPEVTLAMQFERIFQVQLPTVFVSGFHSGSSVKEKRAVWEKLCKGSPMLLIGVHQPVLLPMAHLGLIIVDEEHETGFQEKQHPKINSKYAALTRAFMYNIPIVLGSATPSLQTMHNVQQRGWMLFPLLKRFGGTFPTIKKVIMTQLKDQKRASFWISKELEVAVAACLARKEQAIIFLNRRGYSFFVQCKECGFIVRCQHCSVSLTLHVESEECEVLRCHYCNYQEDFPRQCQSCKAGSHAFLRKGLGTEQVVHIFQKLFPGARIARADLDTTKLKHAWQETVEQFKQGELDILIGTQTITKGYHFKKVTLVGVLWADLNLHFPSYNAAEVTLQQLLQVAGRAGRQSDSSTVIIQVMRDHQIFDYLQEQKYGEFCDLELSMRQESCYPPFVRLAYLEIRHKNEKQVEDDAWDLVEKLNAANEAMLLDVAILGPAHPVVHRVFNQHMRHIVLKSASFDALHKLVNAARAGWQPESQIFIVIDQ